MTENTSEASKKAFDAKVINTLDGLSGRFKKEEEKKAKGRKVDNYKSLAGNLDGQYKKKFGEVLKNLEKNPNNNSIKILEKFADVAKMIGKMPNEYKQNAGTVLQTFDYEGLDEATKQITALERLTEFQSRLQRINLSLQVQAADKAKIKTLEDAIRSSANEVKIESQNDLKSIQETVKNINAALKKAGLTKYSLQVITVEGGGNMVGIFQDNERKAVSPYVNSGEARGEILKELELVLGKEKMNLLLTQMMSATPTATPTGSNETTTTRPGGSIIDRQFIRPTTSTRRPTRRPAAAPSEVRLTKETSKKWLEKNTTTKDGVTTFNSNSAKTLGEVLAHLHQGKDHTLFFRQPGANKVIEGVFDKAKGQYFPKSLSADKRTHANRIMFWKGTSFADRADKLKTPATTPSATPASGPKDKYDAPPKKPLATAALYAEQLKQFVPEMSTYNISAINVEAGPKRSGADYDKQGIPHTLKVATFTLNSANGNETKIITLNKTFELYKVLTNTNDTPTAPATVGLKTFKAVAKEITAAITVAVAVADRTKFAKKAVTETNPTPEKINKIEPPRLKQAILGLQKAGAQITSYTLLNNGDNKIAFKFPTNGDEYEIGPIKYLNRFAHRLEQAAKILPIWSGIRNEHKVDWHHTYVASGTTYSSCDLGFEKNSETIVRWGSGTDGITVSIKNVISKPERLKRFIAGMKKFDENKKLLKNNSVNLLNLPTATKNYTFKKIERFNKWVEAINKLTIKPGVDFGGIKITQAKLNWVDSNLNLKIKKGTYINQVSFDLKTWNKSDGLPISGAKIKTPEELKTHFEKQFTS